MHNRHTTAKSKGSRGARKYFVETFGCQMNYHDSERIAGCSSATDSSRRIRRRRRCRRHQHVQRARARRRETLTRLGELRELAKTNGRDPIVAVAGCVAQQEGER
jgi:tRNA-2-methylthio-N6-dimethylallyladenosine synthase